MSTSTAAPRRSRRPAAKPAKELTRQRLEVVDKPIVVEHNGVEYTIPSPMDWPVDVTVHLGNEDVAKAMVEILGQEQWDAFRSTGGASGGRATMRDLKALFDVVMEFGPGE